MWTFEFFICRQNLYFQHGNQFYFLLSFAGYCALLCNSSSLFIRTKYKNQKFSDILIKSKVAFLLEVILFLSTNGFQTHLGICANANVCVFERTHESRLCLLRSCMVCPGSAVSWNRQDCDRQSIQRMQNTWSIGTGLCLSARSRM